jgi:hypothetical protein
MQLAAILAVSGMLGGIPVDRAVPLLPDGTVAPIVVPRVWRPYPDYLEPIARPYPGWPAEPAAPRGNARLDRR